LGSTAIRAIWAESVSALGPREPDRAFERAIADDELLGGAQIASLAFDLGSDRRRRSRSLARALDLERLSFRIVSTSTSLCI
jgi:hypothetical protein